MGDCEYWVGLGECTANPGFMLTTCRESCGVCNSSSPAPATPGGAASHLSVRRAGRSSSPAPATLGGAASLLSVRRAGRSENTRYAAYKAWRAGMLARSGDL